MCHNSAIYPVNYRRQVFQHKEKHGLTFHQTSELFAINIRTLFRWKNKLKPQTTRNKPATKIDMRALEADIIKNPDSYISERAESFKVSPSCIFYALRTLGYSRKKTLEHPRADKEKRADFRSKIEQYEQEGRSIVYLDESGFAKDMPRTHGYFNNRATLLWHT